MKATIQRGQNKRQRPLLGMLVVLVSVCGFLAVLVLLTAIVHFIMM